MQCEIVIVMHMGNLAFRAPHCIVTRHVLRVVDRNGRSQEYGLRMKLKFREGQVSFVRVPRLDTLDDGAFQDARAEFQLDVLVQLSINRPSGPNVICTAAHLSLYDMARSLRTRPFAHRQLGKPSPFLGQAVVYGETCPFLSKQGEDKHDDVPAHILRRVRWADFKESAVVSANEREYSSSSERCTQRA
jgi:hypothetical protein